MGVLASPVVTTVGIHVTKAFVRGTRLYQRSVITRPVLGDNTPRIMSATGGNDHAEYRLAGTCSSCSEQVPRKGNGGRRNGWPNGGLCSAGVATQSYKVLCIMPLSSARIQP